MREYGIGIMDLKEYYTDIIENSLPFSFLEILLG
ncbi:unnamed protein product, partial [marine sediment metagenome]